MHVRCDNQYKTGADGGHILGQPMLFECMGICFLSPAHESKMMCYLVYVISSHHHHLSLNRDGRWGTTDDFATSFLHFPCSILPSGTCRTPGLSIPRCCLPTSSTVYLVFFPLSLCLARWFWPDLMNGRHDHTTAVCVSLRSSGDLHVDLGKDFLVGNMVFV